MLKKSDLLVKAFKTATNFQVLKRLCSIHSEGYLYNTGWFRSYIAQVPITKDGSPLPWYTYSFIDFIEKRLRPEFEVFEYGCGNGTLYYASRVRYVEAVEHNAEWYDCVSKKCPPNTKVRLISISANGEYHKAVVSGGRKFNIIVIDGRDRVKCIRQIPNAISGDGIVILDNSNRLKYADGIKFLESLGYRHIEFTGLYPGSLSEGCTSVFYKDNNCLGI